MFSSSLKKDFSKLEQLRVGGQTFVTLMQSLQLHKIGDPLHFVSTIIFYYKQLSKEILRHGVPVPFDFLPPMLFRNEGSPVRKSRNEGDFKVTSKSLFNIMRVFVAVSSCIYRLHYAKRYLTVRRLLFLPFSNAGRNKEVAKLTHFM